MIRNLLLLVSASALAWGQSAVTQAGAVLTAPRTATGTTSLLFPYVTSFYGFDSEITISNTSKDTLGTTAKNGSCTLYYYSNGGSPVGPQTTPTINAGGQLVFDMAEGLGGIAGVQNTSGYLIADCGFPLATGYVKVADLGWNFAFGQDAQVLTLPRSTPQYQSLLYPFVSDLAGDTGISVANTMLDPYGTGSGQGDCNATFYGPNALQPYLMQGIAAGSTSAFSVINLDPNFPGTDQGYAIVNCLGVEAAGMGFVSDFGVRNAAYTITPEYFTGARDTSSQGLLFPAVTNQSGYDTEITIANTSADGISSPVSGSCALHFYGANAPAAVNTGTIDPGNVYVALASAIAPNFQGYAIASCTFPLARGWAAEYQGPPFANDGDAETAELVSLPRSTSTPTTLLFSAASNTDGNDTSITISNTSEDPFGTAAEAGTCAISYYGTAAGGKVPGAQTSTSIAAGGQLSFTLSHGNSAQGIAGAPGFSGYVMASCNFPLARGLSTVTSSCATAVSPTSSYLDSSAQSASITVNGKTQYCFWEASSNAPWISIATGSSGTGSGTFTISVEENTSGVARTGTVTVGNQTVTVTQRESAEIFTDVTPIDYYFDFANIMYAAKITGGCSTNPPEYCPDATTTRGEMAVFIITGIEGANSFSYTTAPYFTDVPATNIFFKFIQKMKDLGITGGCSATEFCPDSPVTRGEMAVFVMVARYGTIPFTYPATPYFSDVPASSAFFPFIQKMAQDGITSGCGGGKFCPDDSLTRGQMAVFVVTGLLNELLPTGIPYLTQVTPNLGSAGQTVNVTITGSGTHFAQGSTQLILPGGITSSNVTVTSATSLTAQFAISPGALSSTTSTNGRPYSIVVMTGSEEADLPNGFTVQ